MTSQAQEKTPADIFREENQATIATYRGDAPWQKLSREWLEHALAKRYVYHFSWLGRPIIQLPADIQAYQEIVWAVRPDLIIETGIAHGGSLILSASLLALLEYCEAAEEGRPLDPQKPQRRVLGVDIDIRAHNRAAIEAHPLAHRIDMIQGSSTDADIVAQVKDRAKGYKRVLVSLDSNHTHDHVLEELRAYAPLTSKGSYCLVFDTIVEDMPEDFYPDRPWAPGDNPKTAVHEYLREIKEKPVTAADGERLSFDYDREIEDKLMLTVSPDGFLKRI